MILLFKHNSIKNMTKLKKFIHAYNTTVTDVGICNLVNLEQLKLDRNNKITATGLKLLTKMERLHLGKHSTVVRGALMHMPNLFEFNISYY